MRISILYVINMVKIRVRSGRGTRIIEVDSDATKWTGEEYKKIQEAAKSTSGRGTGKISFSDIPEPKKRPAAKRTKHIR